MQKKVQVKMAFKSFSVFLTKKNIKKADRLCIKFCSPLDITVQQILNSPISKSVPSYSFGPSIFREYLNSQVRINLMVTKT